MLELFLRTQSGLCVAYLWLYLRQFIARFIEWFNNLQVGNIIPTMSNEIYTSLERLAIKVLGPIVRMMLRNGVACGNLEALLREVYVDEAFKLAKKAGKATVSAVSAQTGLSRKEVKRLAEKQTGTSDEQSQKYNRAIRVISGWLNDQRFSSANGVPLVLDFEGSENSFIVLAKDYSGDIPARTMFNLLEKSGCVEMLNGRVQLISHAYVPGNDPVDVINILATDTPELMETIVHNMSCEKQDKWFQRKVSTHHLHVEHIDEFQKYSKRRSQSLLEDLDNWLSEHEAEAETDKRFVSVGVYFYRHEADSESEKKK